MDLIVYDVACMLEVNRVDDLVKTVVFVAVLILGLASVSCKNVKVSSGLTPRMWDYYYGRRLATHLNSARRVSRSAAHP